MNVGIITFHFVNNFGGVLQAYALQKAVSDQFGVRCELIDYQNWFIRFTDTVRLFPVTADFGEFVSGLKTMRERLGRRKRFQVFMKKNCTFSGCYRSQSGLKLHPPEYDRYICGSDQVWNPVITMGVSDAYFLGFVDRPEKKIAYAPSFGSNQIWAVHKNRMKKLLASIGFLSVREESGQNVIREMTGRNAVRLIDPTFLLDKTDWEKLGCGRQSLEPYILLYIMQKDETVYRYAEKIKRKKKMRLIEISRYGYRPDFVDEVLVDVGPSEFLGLFRDAEYICTNSYHGLVYSVIFEKKFCLVPCRRFQARLTNLLKLLHMENDRKKQGNYMVVYDRDYVRAVIEKERKKAMRYLSACMGCDDSADY